MLTKEEFIAKYPYLMPIIDKFMEALAERPEGCTRTELRYLVPSYHKLRGENRTAVVDYLVTYGGIVEVQVAGGRAVRLVKSRPAPDNSESSVAWFNRCTSEGPWDDDEETVEEDNVGNLLKPGESPQYHEPPTIESVGKEIIKLLESIHGEILMNELYDLIPEYAELDEESRRLCTKQLLDSKQIGMGRRKALDGTGHCGYRIWLLDENSVDGIVYQQSGGTDLPNTALADALRNAVSKKPKGRVTTTTKTVQPPEPRGYASAEPTTPETPVLDSIEAPTQIDIGVLREHVTGLGLALGQIPNAPHNNPILRAQLQTLHTDLQTQHRRLEKAVRDQVEILEQLQGLMSQLGLVIETQLNN